MGAHSKFWRARIVDAPKYAPSDDEGIDRCSCAQCATEGKAVQAVGRGSFYLEVVPNGVKYWRMKYRFAGREKRLAIGVYPDISSKRALAERDRARLALHEHRDPSGEKRIAKLSAKTAADNSFENIAEEWLEMKASIGRRSS